MSGHSKFANIKHKKEKNDAAKGKIFTVNLFLKVRERNILIATLINIAYKKY